MGSGGEKEDYIKCELETFKHFLAFLLLAVQYTHQYNTCYMLCLLLLLTAPVYIMLSIRTYHTLLLFTASIARGSAGFLRGLGNIAQEKTTADILIEDQLQPPLDMLTVE